MISDQDARPRLFELPRTQKWRVTLCRLENEAWHEHGLGHIWCERNEKEKTTWLLVEDERHSGELLMRCKVQAPLSFRKQDMLLFCAAPEDHISIKTNGEKHQQFSGNGLVRMAIGFQDITGCVSICDFLIYAAYTWAPGVTVAVQHTADNGTDIDLELVVEPLSLPPLPSRENVELVLRTMSRLLRTALGREFLAIYLDQEQYLDHMYMVFTELESLGNKGTANDAIECIRALWILSDIMKQYFLLGDGLLFDNMVDSDQYIKVLGILEYDRTFGGRKANFRDYYCNHTELKQVVEINDTPVLEKIRRTFRLQLLRDILVRSADDFPFQILRTLIYINQVEIVDSLQNSTTFCDDLFGLFDDTAKEEGESTDKSDKSINDLREQALKFINEIVKISKTFTVNQMRILYETFADYGLFDILNVALATNQPVELKVIVLESLGVLLDFDAQLAAANLETLVETVTGLICEQQSDSAEAVASAVQIQASELLKKLMAEEPKLTAETFFKKASLFLADNKDDISARSIQLILDIVSYSYVRAPAQTTELSIGLSLWPQLASTKIIRTKFDHNTDAGVVVALLRAMQDAIQPAYTEDIDKVVDQAKELIKTELIGKVLELLNALGNVNKMIHSSCLCLAQIIAAGLLRGEPQFDIVAYWMATEKSEDVEKLSKLFPAFKDILTSANYQRSHTTANTQSDAESIVVPDTRERPATRKRSTSSEYFAGRIGSVSRAQRPRIAHTVHSHRPMIDEVDSRDEKDGWPIAMNSAAPEEHSGILERHEHPSSDEHSGLLGFDTNEMDSNFGYQNNPDHPSHSFWSQPMVQSGITTGPRLTGNAVLLHSTISRGSSELHDPDMG